jgi:uncharacterized protein YggE
MIFFCNFAADNQSFIFTHVTMKTIFSFPVMMTAMVLAVPNLKAQQAPSPMTDRTITVLASGSAGAVADRVTLGLTVSSADPTATGLFVKQDDIVKHLEEALEKGGIEVQDITEQPFHLMPNMEYGQNGTKIIGYRIDTPIEVELDNVKDLPRVIDLATQSGASSINVGAFGIAPGHNLHEDAVKDAIANARKEAASIAKEMGKTVGDIVSISEAGDETAAPAAAKGGEEEEEEREGGQKKAKAAQQQQSNTLSEKTTLKVVFMVH